MTNKTNFPKVSVCIVTYNQEDYIRQCLQSVVDQERDFEIEILVSDDASTDKTCEIIKYYLDMYPLLVKAFFHKKNFGDRGFSNYKFIHRIALGQYVSHLDGDDCMYPSKLSKQVKFLDEHPECSLVAHQLDVYKDNEKITITPKNNEKIDISGLLKSHTAFLHSSIMYRSEKIKKLYYSNFNFIDFYLYVFAARLGYIGFINEALGKYNLGVGISSKHDLMTYIQAAIDLASDKVSDDILNFARSKQYLGYAISALKNNEREKFIKNIRLAKKYNNYQIKINILYFFRKYYKALLTATDLYKKIKTTIRKLKFIPKTPVHKY